MLSDNFYSKPWLFTVLAVVVLGLAGCSWQGPWAKPTSNSPKSGQSWQKQWQQQLDELTSQFTLESELRSLFSTAAIETNEQAIGVYVYPMANYTTQRTANIFGQYLSPASGQRFSGYHTGDDIEVANVAADPPVFALTNATVVRKETVPGLGGVVILEFSEGGVIYHALYGNLDLGLEFPEVGEAVTAGQLLGYLGDDRQHLFFSIYPYTGAELFASYTEADSDLTLWENPADWLRIHQATEPSPITRHQ